ncbi:MULTISPECIES: M15 family metallopeptidase [Citrobacter]|uniref:M15 family metallopeptidase n=1 Tax=Citrobacter TaxID=544 RepID=UPI001122985C|nr:MULTISPECIES: M15 family metallopeptidase [Citrobacter]EKX2181743.1 M15 family metallopeptidase [Citrobacter freundii]MBA7997651.1 M15 family metallopeptidase [Citrobacter freundii]MBJ8965554.1 M15 family metallopeptidase [Citrobacter freundii]MDV1634474.1 M15 family metallopeptidase [Citrobacter freundii]MDV1713831.1 M15 family metallopeptidase [Citrobacter freundii]
MKEKSFSERSILMLKNVHTDLSKLAFTALELSVVNFGITEGLRSAERQQQLFNEGKSKTLNSRHLSGHAIDVLAYPTSSGSWEFKYYQEIAVAFKKASSILDIPIEWGGDWKSFCDGPHFQLPWQQYPAN